MTQPVKILVVDDTPKNVKLLNDILTVRGFDVVTAASGEEALEKIDAENPELVLLDVMMPGMSGHETLKKIKEKRNGTQVILITAHASFQDAVSAIKLGAYDYLTKPINIGQLEATVNRAMEVIKLNREVNRLAEVIEDIKKSDSIITQNKTMLDILASARRIAGLDSSVLITGESGTGKDLLARTIHDHSARRNKPFIAINCAALGDDLLASALFGFEKGAFTGAIQTTKGCFEEAHEGTLFLDEVGDMNPKLQSSLLRVLQEREFCRIGSYQPIKADFRLLTATNKNMETEVETDRFRQDLYYRLNVINIHIPPLRDRKGDIPLLALYFLESLNKSMETSAGPISPAAMKLLSKSEWKGNCRELRNVIERAIAIRQNSSIEIEDLPDFLRGAGVDINAGQSGLKLAPLYSEAKNLFEKEFLKDAMEKYDGNISKISRQTGILRANLYEKLKKHGLK